jgi:hypothetical protein
MSSPKVSRRLAQVCQPEFKHQPRSGEWIFVRRWSVYCWDSHIEEAQVHGHLSAVMIKMVEHVRAQRFNPRLAEHLLALEDEPPVPKRSFVSHFADRFLGASNVLLEAFTDLFDAVYLQWRRPTWGDSSVVAIFSTIAVTPARCAANSPSVRDLTCGFHVSLSPGTRSSRRRVGGISARNSFRIPSTADVIAAPPSPSHDFELLYQGDSFPAANFHDI